MKIPLKTKGTATPMNVKTIGNMATFGLGR